jgi:lysophospholipase L1-like esterase
MTAGAVVLAVGLSRCAATPAAAPATASAPAPVAAAGIPSGPDTASASTLPSAAASDATERGTPKGKRRYVVAVIGDSLTDSRVGGGQFVAYVAKRCPRSRFDNFGKGGDMVNQMRKRFERDVSGATDYTHLLVFGGVNDLYSDLTAGRTLAKIEADLAYMYGQAHQRGWRVIALTVAPWGGFSKYYNASRAGTTRELNDWIRAQLAAKTVDFVVDAYSLLSCGDPDKLCPDFAGKVTDGLHFGPAGHEKLGEALYSAVFSDCL